MANIQEKIKKDKTVAYYFSCCLGRDAFGKQICRYTTWYAPKDLSQSKGRKAAEKAAQVWEEEVRAEYEKDLQNPKRIAIKEVANEKTHFEDFVNDIWFPICIDNGEHKISTVSFYRQTADSIINYFSGYSLQSMNIFALKKFFVFLKKEKAYSAQYKESDEQKEKSAIQPFLQISVNQSIDAYKWYSLGDKSKEKEMNQEIKFNVKNIGNGYASTVVLHTGFVAGGIKYNKLIATGESENLCFFCAPDDLENGISFGIQYIDAKRNEYVQEYEIIKKYGIIDIECGYPEFIKQI